METEKDLEIYKEEHMQETFDLNELINTKEKETAKWKTEANKATQSLKDVQNEADSLIDVNTNFKQDISQHMKSNMKLQLMLQDSKKSVKTLLKDQENSLTK